MSLKTKVATVLQEKMKRVKFVKQVERLVTERKESFLRFRDKLSFVFGVVNIALTAFIFGRFPNWMPLYFTIKFFVLMGTRLFLYRSKKWHYFLLDFCYFVNVLVLIYLHIFPSSHLLFTICFSFSNGPLAWAIVAWRNSMVFHSLDKMTSIFIHLGPPMVMYSLRWFHSAEKYNICKNIDGPVINGLGLNGEECQLSFWDAYVIPILPYIVWQVAYLIKVEVVSKKKVIERGYMTSFRWMAEDPNSLVSKWGTRFESSTRLQSLRNNIINSSPSLNSTLSTSTGSTSKSGTPSTYSDGTHLTKLLVFLGMQLLYTLLTLLPVWVLYHYFWLHSFFLASVLLLSVWNGANFYIDVFSKRYIQSLQEAVNKANGSVPTLASDSPVIPSSTSGLPLSVSAPSVRPNSPPTKHETTTTTTTVLPSSPLASKDHVE